MLAKIRTAIAMPFIVAGTVGALAVTTHHTKIPPLNPPPTPYAPPKSPGNALSPTLTTYERACRGELPKPFAGIAVNHQIGQNVLKFHQMTGAHIRVVEFYNPFPGPFQAGQALQASKAGALPLIQLNPRTIKMRRVAAGGYDSEIKAYAKAVKAFPCDIVLSLGHEMNGWWYPWGLPWTTPKVFKAAWRHFHDIFTREGVTNVIWSWDPTHQYTQFKPTKAASLASEWYPGNKYVDIVGLDGYLNPGQNFKEVFTHQLASIRSVAGSKPIYLAETGVAKNPDAIQQIDNLFAGLQSYHLAGLIWFDQNRKQQWELQGRKPAIAEYHKLVANFK